MLNEKESRSSNKQNCDEKKSKFVKFETNNSQADEVKSKGTSRLQDNEESNYVIMINGLQSIDFRRISYPNAEAIMTYNENFKIQPYAESNKQIKNKEAIANPRIIHTIKEEKKEK